jgi:hypothetical protein
MTNCRRVLRLFAASLVFAVFSTATAKSFDLYSPNDGDQLALGIPYTITFEEENRSSDTLILVLIRCPYSNSRISSCDEVARWSGLRNNGSFTWNMSSPDLNDGKFYVFQLLNTRTNDVATSGVFTFLPLPVSVDTTYVWRRSFSHNLSPSTILLVYVSHEQWFG